MTLNGSILLDDIDVFDTYGVFAIRGSLDALVKMPTMKAPTSVSLIDQNGEMVFLQNRKVDNEDMALTFLLSGFSVEEMWRKRDALAAHLKADTTTGNKLYVRALDRYFTIYYKGCSSAKFYQNGKKRIEMVLNFRLLN